MEDAGGSLGHPASRAAQRAALRVAQEAAAHVPAYGRFLRRAGYDADRLRTFADFCQLPTMDKASYLQRYSLGERCRQADLTRAYITVASSGTSGGATLWPRYPEQEPATIAGVRTLLQEHFRILDLATLVVIAAATGPWAYATGMTLATQRIFAEPGVCGTVVTPGLNQDETLRFIAELGPHYDQVLLVSYPALVPSLLEAGSRRGIDWPSLAVSVLTMGEGATEAQREAILRQLGADAGSLRGFVNAFSATEAAGVIGYESRLCLLLRRLCIEQPALAKALFGTPILPSINQYNPLGYFLETSGDEVLLTMRGAVPLIRYNTHDRGGLLSFAEVITICRAHGYDLQEEWRQRQGGPVTMRPAPFFYVHGRSDAVILHGGNVYLDEIAHVLEQPPLGASNTGHFEVSQAASADGQVTLRLVVELREGISPGEGLSTQYERDFLAGLRSVSPRFQAAYDASQGRAKVVVTLVPHGRMAGSGPKRRRVVLPHDSASTDNPASANADHD
ncbi:MAG TPA: hypothetical protein VK066_22045 [Chloroflexota bacterium]|nr:hypothetical protein [Chloroflexota bacterium]